MTIVGPFDPIYPLTPHVAPISSTSPFTYRSARTYLETLEDLRKYINKNLVDKSNTDLANLVDAVNAALDEQSANVDGTVAGLVADVNAAIQAVIDSSIEIQDPVTAQLVQDTASQLRAALDAVYASSSSVTDLSDSVDSRFDGLATDLDSRFEGVAGQFDSVDALFDSLDVEFDGIESNIATVAGAVDTLGDYILFDPERAQTKYGMRLNNHGVSRVMQSAFVSRKLNGQVFFSQTYEGSIPTESFQVTRLDAAGKPLGWMRFAQAGHGAGVFVEVDNAGQVWVWTQFSDYRLASGEVNFDNQVRVPWANGVTHTIETALPYAVPSVSRTGRYSVLYYDEHTDVILRRENSGLSRIMQSFNRTDVLTAANDTALQALALTSCTYVVPANTMTHQFALLNGVIYAICGSNPTATPYDVARVIYFDANTGAEIGVRNLEHLRNVPGNIQNYSEPETIAVGRAANGEPSLVIGFAYGITRGRSQSLWALTMQGTPFIQEANATDFEHGNTGWQQDVFASLTAGLTLDNTDQYRFGARIAGGYLEFRGRISGTFQHGNFNVGVLREEWGVASIVPSAAAHVPIGKHMTATSPHATARLEISAAENFNVYSDFSNTNTYSWISLDGVRIPIRRPDESRAN